MTSWRVHIIFGFILVSFVYTIIWIRNLGSIISFLKYIPVIFLASQLPDLDSHSSVIRKLFYTIFLLFSIFLTLLFFYYKNIIFLIISIILLIVLFSFYFLKHRGKMHTILAAIVISLPFLLIDIKLPVIIFLSYFSHLLVDFKLDLY